MDQEQSEIFSKAKQEKDLSFHSKKEPRRSLQTFLRNQSKYASTATVLADRKAMIMIRINATIISALIVFYQYIDSSVEHGSLMVGILMVGTGGALICSVLAARPNGWRMKRIFNKHIKPEHPHLEENNFLTFTNPTLKEYEESMKKVVDSQELQIGNQVRFNFMIEKYLLQKYVLLDIAYNFFLVSFIVVAGIFLVSKYLV